MPTTIPATNPALDLASIAGLVDTSRRTYNLTANRSLDSAATPSHISQSSPAHFCSRGIAAVTVTLASDLAGISILGEEKLIQLSSGNSVLPSLLSSSGG